MLPKINFTWFPGTWEVAMFKHENPSARNFVGLGLWLVDRRFPDRLPWDIFEPVMMCPPQYSASFGPIPAVGSSPFSAIKAPSYEESVLGAVEAYVENIRKLPVGSPCVVGGYSQGADVAERVKGEHASGGRLAAYPLWACYTFGPPSRKAGVTFPNGNTLPWSGITRLEIPTPAGCLERAYCFHDDMYGNAPFESYLPEFYTGLTDLQFHNPMKLAADTIRNVSQTDLMILAGAKPTSPVWVITNLPKFLSISRKAINSLDALARFARSGAHSHYHDWEIIPGFTPVNHCIRSMKYLAKGKGYRVPGI